MVITNKTHFLIAHFGYKRLMLIAKSLAFNHPVSGEKIIHMKLHLMSQWQQVFKELALATTIKLSL